MIGEETLRRFYVIISGRMKVSQTNPDTGRELTIFLLAPGDVFDIICLLDDCEHHINVTALDDLDAISAPLHEVRGWIERHPEFNRTLLPYLGKQLRTLEELATDLTLHDTCTRLSKLILRNIDYQHTHTKLKLINDLSQEELANMIGSVRAVINRHMLQLKKDGIIETNTRHIQIKDLHSLLKKVEKGIGLS